MATPTSSDDGSEPPPATWPQLQAGRRAESVQGVQLRQAKDRQRAQIRHLDETVEQAQLRRVKAGEQAQLTCTCGQDDSGDLSDQGYLGHEVWSVSV